MIRSRTHLTHRSLAEWCNGFLGQREAIQGFWDFNPDRPLWVINRRAAGIALGAAAPSAPDAAKDQAKKDVDAWYNSIKW